MSYTHTSLGILKTQLSSRLEDTGTLRFWTDTELTVLIQESLRTFGLLSAFWRERGTFSTVASTFHYDLPTELPSLLGYTVTDRDLIQSIQFALLESASTQSSWPGTDMFTYDAVVRAIERRRNQFLSDTGLVLTRSVVPVIPPPSGRLPLADNIIDVRRAAWIGASPLAYYTYLCRDDEFSLTAFNPDWSVTPSQPTQYSVFAPPPLTFQFAPPPIVSGQLELVTVDTGTALDPAVSATVLGIPDDATWIVKWGALADLLGQDGQARDPIRAQYCELRYQQGIQLVRMMPFVIHTEINGVPHLPSTLWEVDHYRPNWQNKRGALTSPQAMLAIEGSNLLWTFPVPDNTYAITLDVVRRTPVPVLDADQIQIGREQLDMILDYAEHLALFKVGGAEFDATQRQAQNFLLQSVTYNQRLSAAARYVIVPKESSQREKQSNPRRKEAIGLGTLENG